MLGPKQEAQAALPPIPHLGFLFVIVGQTTNACSRAEMSPLSSETDAK